MLSLFLPARDIGESEDLDEGEYAAFISPLEKEIVILNIILWITHTPHLWLEILQYE